MSWPTWLPGFSALWGAWLFLLLIPASLLPGDNITTYLGVLVSAALLGRDYLTVRRERGRKSVPSAPQAAE